MTAAQRVVGVAVLAALLLAAGCNDDDRGGGDGPGRLRVVASFYPLAEAAERVGGRRVEAVNLTPAGTEPHDLELSADQVVELEDADVLVVLGGGFQPAVEKIARRRQRPTLEVLDALGDAGDDPHVWLDPVQMAEIVGLVADTLASTDPPGDAGYRAGADRFRKELTALHERYQATMATCQRRLMVTAHEAFGHLAARYRLEQEGVTGLSPESEPDPRRTAQLARQVRESGATTVFTEALLPVAVARALAREAGVKVATLDPLESLSEEQLDAGEGYVSVMDRNRRVLAEALGCRA